ncbi:TPA: hypothetical protein LC237_001496 [Salmonella enterica subsp. enterica serovar Saintpaul]|nr:hypothetical protein [Salmonella enterica subsp. enterica serovar Saintpaul]
MQAFLFLWSMNMPLIPDVRPETQKINPSRTDLNIAQPGEQPAFDYDSYLDSLTPETVKDYRTGANLKDYGIAVTSGAANLPEGVGALANFGGQWLKKKAGELSPDHFVAKSALSDIGGFLHKGGQAVQEGVSDWKQDLESGYSEQAKNALEQGATGSIAGLTLNLANVFGDLGSIALTGGLEGLAVKGATSALLKREAVSGLVRKGLSKEAAEKVANDAMEVAARKATAAQAGKTASKYGFIASGTADAQGNTAAAAAQGVLNASPQELASSPTFVNLYQSVQSDPQYAHLSDADKVQVAKEQLASRVGMSVATDPKLLAVNIGSTMMGDKAVADMVLNGVSKSIVGGFTKGALREGALNGLQSGYSQYAQNVARDEDAGIATDHMQGVRHAAGEGTLLGGIIGGGAGLVSGVRGRNSKPDTQRTDAAHEAFNARAERAREMAEDSPYTTPADPVENYRRQFSGLSRDELLEHYANADFAPEGDAEAVYRKHAASGLLRDMDRTRQVKGMIDEMRAKPRSEVLEEYRTLSEKEKRSDAEEMRLDAAREVLKPQPEAGTEEAKPAEAPQEPGISVPTVRFGDDVPHIEITGGAPRPPERIEKVRSDNDYFADARSAKNSDVFRHAEQAGLKPEVVKKGERQYVVEMDNPQVSEDRARETINTLAMGERIPDKPKTPDPMDIPAFMRDPRFRDFTDEPTDVQKRLTRGNAPTAEELVHEQMARGDAGPTDYELAERPRLPPPGDIHPGQGYPLPGDVRRMPDEPPAGRGGRYTTTGEVRGQSYEKGRQTVASEGVQRQGETFPGEPSYRELPAPARQGLPRPEVAEPESPGPATTEQPGNPSRRQERQAEAQSHEEEVAKKLAEKKERETQERNNAVRKHKERLSSYLDSVDEKSRDTARKFLRQGLNNPYGRGRLYISDLVEKRVDDGWRIKKDKDGRPQRLVGSNGESLGAGDITQYGLDYADHILRTEKSGEKIGDFGEVIHGAAKHRRAALAEALNTDKTIEDYHTQPLSRLFPEPDYEKMAAEGTDNRTLAMLALLRNMIPAKPRVPHRLNRWAKQVDDVRDTAGQLLDGSLPADKFIDRIRQERGSYYSEMVKTWEMLHRLPPARMKQAAGYRVKSHAYSMVNGKEYNPPKVVHTLENEKGRSVLNAEDLNDLYKKAKAYFEQQSALPKSADSKTKLDIYQNRRTGEVFIAYGKNKTSLQGGFKTVAEARDYAKNNRAELLEKLNALREQSREEQRNASNRDRTGPDRREGNVTPEKFSGAFGFRGVQFGNYVEGPRRQSDLNRAYDSLMDMADVLKVPAKALSLNGRLGLAFGARGKGGKNAAAAHYEPGEVAINLTKGNGAGSLAHEWFHALDNYFGQYDAAREGEITSGDKFMTSNNKRWPQWNDKEKEYLHPVRQEVYDAFKGVVNAVNKSGMVDRARRLDEVRSKPYWSTDVEMAARAFERYVQDRAKAAGVENDFLVNIRKADDHGSPETYAYPTDAELDGGIRRAFDNLFRTLKTRETDRGVAFYSRRGVKRTPEGNVISETGHSKEAKGSPVPQVKAVARTVMKRIKDIDLDVRVVKTQAEAAELAGESLDGYGKVHAFYRPEEREIVLVADNLPDGRTVREKLRHEIIHHALESVVTPAEYKTIVDNVLKTRDSDNAVIRETWRRVDADYGNESPEVQAGEFLAHMAEKHTPGKLSAAWNRVVALVKAVLRRTGLLQPSDLSDAGYIRDTLRTLGQRVREGYVPREGGDVSYSRTGKTDPFRADAYDAKVYAAEVRRIAELEVAPRGAEVRVGDTPPVLRALGAPNRELMMPARVIHKATRPAIKDHHVLVDTMANLPHLLADPVAVMTSRTEHDSLVTLIEAKDAKGAPVIVAVHMHARGAVAEVNKIASVYGKDNRQVLQDQLNNDLLYINKEKAADWLLSAGLQLPGANTINGSSGTKVLQPDDIRKGPYYSRSTSDLSPEETLAARFVRQMQDKFQVLKAVQDNIRKSGGKLDDSNNAYLAEELFHGKAENDLNAMKERYVKPLAKLLAEYDIPQSALDDYLYARHAPERNLHIAKINPKMPDGGSGMTNAEAAAIMDRVRRSGKQAQYDRLAGIVDDMLARRRELITEAGLEDKGTVDAWQKAYKYYVPLKGQDTDGVVLPRTGKGFVISGRESKQAMGRNSRAQSPSTQAMQDLTASLIRRRKNEVGNAFLKLVQDNPDRDYWQVFTDDSPDTTRRIVEKNDPVTGETIRRVEEMPVPMAIMSDKYFTTRKDGKTYYIKLHDERLMRAMKNMGPETGNVVIQTLARVNRFLSSVNTTFNPEFLVSNFARDMQTAVMNLKAEQGRDDGKLNGRDIAMKTVRDSGIAMKAVYASLRNKSLSGKGAEWQKTWKEFVEDGAKTGWFRMEDLNGQMKEMDRLVALAKGGWQGQGIQAWHSFFKLVEDGNNAVENALRLSAYKHARDAGLSRAQAASLAKNMTVNFNRRGEQGVLLNSLYMFANASIQGTANMMRSLAHLNGEGPLLQRLRWKNLNMAQKVALAATGAGYLIASLNRAGAGQDDDGVNWYDKVPDYVKEHNLVIMKSLFGGKPGEYWSIPLPYGYNMFFLLGGTAEGVIRGDLKATRAAGNIVGGLLGAFNPLGSEDSKTLTGTLLKNATPTIFRPAMDLAMNENFMGTQIYRENFPGGTPKPESTLGRRSTPEAYKVFADWLNRTSGGSQYRSGAVDINPDIMKYWIDYVSGGMGRFAGKTLDAAAKSYNGTDIPSQQIPFLGKISGQVLPYDDQQKMYDRIDELRQYDAELKTLRGADRTAFLNKYRGQISMNGIIHQTQHQLKNLRKQRDEIYSDPTLSAREQSQRVKAVELRMKAVTDRFNREYREKVGD